VILNTSMRRSIRTAIGFCSLAILSACGSLHNGSRDIPKVPESSPAARAGIPNAIVMKGHHLKPLALVSRGGTLHSFSEALHANLKTDADFDRFVDPAVTGTDRQLAIRLLRLMPANMRGDFVYVDPASQKIVSNRPELVKGIRLHQRPLLHPSPQGDTKNAMSVARQTRSYPPVGGSGGPYIRHYSAQGVNAAAGYATVPCDARLSGGDHGFMYFNAYSQNSGGSVVDAGLEVYPGNIPHPFINEAGRGYLYSGWTDENYSWNCGEHLGVFYGTITGQGILVLMIGRPDFDPTIYQFPPATTTWRHAAWNFSPAPTELTMGFGIWNGLSSECMGCSVAKMFSVSPGNPGSISCFGLCQGNNVPPNGRWDQVVMGEIVQPCQNHAPTSAVCTLRYPTDNSWSGGYNDGGLGYEVYTAINPNRAIEGINLSGSANFSSQITEPAGVFSELQPPPPAQCSDIRAWVQNNAQGGSGPDADGLMYSFPPNGVATFDHTSTGSVPVGGGYYDTEYAAYWTLPNGAGTLVAVDHYTVLQDRDTYSCYQQ
jgi:hypothetical protein